MAFFGVIFTGFCVGTFQKASLGTDPFTCMNLGVSSHLPVSFAVYQMIFNVLLFIPVFILDRKSFGIGALINMLLLGYFVEFFMFLFAAVGITIEGMAGNMAMRIPALIPMERSSTSGREWGRMSSARLWAL